MSIPPSSAPPPFAQYGTPPHSPPSSSGGCWKAAGITCGVLLLLGIVAVVIGGLAVRRAVHNHSGMFGTFMNIGTTIGNGVKIQRAIVQYHTTHGRYPDTLTDLVADGDIDGKILHSPLDPNSDPGHISWTYHRPTATSAPNAPLLTMHYTLTIPGANTQQTTGSDIVINLDGTTSSNATTSTETHSSSP